MITSELLEKLTDVANAVHRTDEIEIDPLQGEKELSISQEGIWVRAWVYLSYELLESHGLPECQDLYDRIVRDSTDSAAQ